MGQLRYFRLAVLCCCVLATFLGVSLTCLSSEIAVAESGRKDVKATKKPKASAKTAGANKSDKRATETSSTSAAESTDKTQTVSAVDSKPSSNAPTGADKQQSTIESAMGFKTGQGNEPLFINSDTLTVESKKRTFTYTGSVKMIQGETNIDADVVVGKYDENNVIQEVICEGNVHMTKGPGLKATSNRAVYTLATHTVVLSEGPEITHEGSTLTADLVRVFLDQDRSEAEGNVKVKVVKSETKDHTVQVPSGKGK